MILGKTDHQFNLSVNRDLKIQDGREDDGAPKDGKD